jgi:hypothetical protein
MNDWEKKERFTYPTGRDGMESHTPEETPGFLDKYGFLIFSWIVGIVVVGICRALGIARLSP